LTRILVPATVTTVMPTLTQLANQCGRLVVVAAHINVPIEQATTAYKVTGVWRGSYSNR